jgi:hypothetical protein
MAQSNRAPAQQVLAPKFKPQHHQKKKRKKEGRRMGWDGDTDWLGMVAHIWNPSTQKAEAGRLKVW